MGRVLVACEYSGEVRRAFQAQGHEAISCDLLPADDGSPDHYQGDMFDIVGDGFDLLIAFPPCTHLCVSGARWFASKGETLQLEALNFVQAIMDAPVPRIAIENPVGVISTNISKPAQYIQPWMFGHGETKKTGLWLINLPLLVPTNIVEGREQRIHNMFPSPDRWKLRSATYSGVAAGMAAQWGPLLPK